VKRDFGPIIAYMFTAWYKVQKLAKICNKLFYQSPIFRNYSLLIDGKPIIFPQWSDKDVHKIQDIVGQQGLRKFHDLQKSYNLQGISFFFYLQLRAAMRAQGIPWGALLENHPLHGLLCKNSKNNAVISALYKYITVASYKSLLLDNVWRKDIICPSDLDWHSI